MTSERADQLWETILDRALAVREGEEQMATYASGLGKLNDCSRRCYWDRVDPIRGDSRKWYAAAEPMIPPPTTASTSLERMDFPTRRLIEGW